MDQHAWCIFGYAKFYEPLVRRCICLSRPGWQDVTAETITPTIAEVSADLAVREDWQGELARLKRAARKALAPRKRRISLDAVFADEGGAITGEFKSWGGAHRFTLDEIRDKLASGKMCPERLAIRRVIRRGEELQVTGFVFATVLADDNAPGGQCPLGNLAVHVENIPALLRDYGREAAAELGALARLDESAAQVKRFVETGAAD